MPAETIAPHVTAEEYLERERAAWNSKSEWIDGEVREITGAKYAHNTICFNIAGLLSNMLKGRPFSGCPGDMKVRTPAGSYRYPDVVIVPDPPEFEDGREDVVLNPIVLVEVLSPSTEEVDRGRKLDEYRRLPSLRSYLLVDQFESRIDHYALTGETWDLTITTDLAATVPLPAIGCELPLAEVYDRILPARES